MALEQVLSDRDSEDEVDDDIADLEDRRVSLKVLPNSFFFFTSFSSFAYVKMMHLDFLLLVTFCRMNRNMITFSIAI